MEQIKLLTILVNIALVLSLVNLYGFFTLYNKIGTGAVVDADVGEQVPQPVGDVTLLFDDDVIKGSKDAPVTIIEYSDPSCPFCAAAAGKNKEVINYLKQRDTTWEAPVPGVMKDYVASGKVKIVFRYFPGHGSGAEAMKIMLCANDQGKFWEVHDLVFDNQDKVEDVVALKNLAKQVGVDVAKIDSCLASKKYDAKLQKDTELGTRSGVRGTPGFFVNKQAISGAVPYSSFKQVIEQELKK